MAIDKTPVQSSAISQVGYDPQTKTIHVGFRSGGTHPFGPFTQEEFDRFRNAPSISEHFHLHIRSKAIK
ncbi:KTSC domain-containing protein [Acidicapsa dinghuensis]|uniref:KTSC domain-containing protein n=1 Tax=Acidicapsa dinghuensis TaxID=2218256 RepID=A0ABW1ECG6_9BACT|nr:KTSC domain-containing protein [Acidicapsa dinghuensis]